MTDGRLIEIEARARLATPTLKTYCASGRWVLAGIGHIREEADARFFDGAREDVLWLIAAVRDRDAEIERLRARVAELDDGGWRPIETAPEDGTSVLIWDGRRVSQSEYITSHHFSGWMTCYMGRPEPTHWRPLPAPPPRRTEIPHDRTDL